MVAVQNDVVGGINETTTTTATSTTSIPLNNSTTSTSTQPIPYKEVVVVGNGPSGIVQSYLLAGNWPYYNGLGESVNDMLHYRLLASSAESGQSISLVEQDLDFFSQGLEGRSTNPVAILFDELNHPQADLGLELPSLLNWEFRPENKIDHVVIGKGKPGGAWQGMDGNILTISLGCWMELPQMNFRDWTAQQKRYGRESRASVASVAQYYCDYVKNWGLQKYFLCDSVITEVTRHKQVPYNCDNNLVMTADGVEGGEDEAERGYRRHTISEIPMNCNSYRAMRKRNRPLWKVKGFTKIQGINRTPILRPFAYITPNLVLATGADKPNVLNVSGENLPFVLHSLNHLENLIASGHLNRDSDPVLIVGAGLSAADAIIAARFHCVSVVHVFRRNVNDPNLIFRNLPAMYPEYHKVYQMMCNPGYDYYEGYEAHIVSEICHDQTVVLSSKNCSKKKTIKVSYVAVCIGSQPDLSFLGGIENNLGVFPGLPVDCQRNPVEVNFYSHESVREPGLFALGPVAGQNFVRFLQGGSLAVTNHLVRQQKNE